MKTFDRVGVGGWVTWAVRKTDRERAVSDWSPGQKRFLVSNLEFIFSSQISNSSFSFFKAWTCLVLDLGVKSLFWVSNPKGPQGWATRVQVGFEAGALLRSGWVRDPAQEVEGSRLSRDPGHFHVGGESLTFLLLSSQEVEGSRLYRAPGHFHVGG